MNREILFRGKMIDNGEWQEGNYVKTPDGSYIVVPYKKASLFGEGTIIEIDSETIGQYTGMTDESGRKIFEGDIFKYITSTIDGNPICGKACVDSIFNYKLMRNMDTSNSLEIIGNIYENTESLK